MNAPSPWLLVFGAVIGGLSVAVVIVGLDLQPDRVTLLGLMGMGVLVTVAVVGGIAYLVSPRPNHVCGTYAVFDPRLGHDYRLSSLSGTDEFSSLAESVFVIRANSVNWKPVASALDALFVSTGGRGGYVVYWPWSPGRKTRIATFRAAFPDASGRFEQIAVEAFTAGFAVRILTLRSSVGGSAGGNWIFGVGEETATLSAAVDGINRSDPLSAAVNLIGKADAALVLDEDELSVLLVAMKPAVFDAVEGVTNALAAAGYEARVEA